MDSSAPKGMSEVAFVRQERYDDATKDHAFLVWMWECESDFLRTAQYLAKHEMVAALDESRPPNKTPSEDTLRRWANEGGWGGRRYQIVSAPGLETTLYNHALGRHMLLLEKAATRHTEILNLPLTEPVVNRDGEVIGEKPSPALPTILKAIESVYTIARLIGRTNDIPTGPPQLPPPRDTTEDGGEDMNTRLQRQQRRIAESKQRKRGKS
jgi:hypothetical protein